MGGQAGRDPKEPGWDPPPPARVGKKEPVPEFKPKFPTRWGGADFFLHSDSWLVIFGFERVKIIRGSAGRSVPKSA